MPYKFHEDFALHDEAGKSYNIRIERNSDFEHGHSAVKDNAYHVFIPGNKHFARTPRLRNFKLKLKLKIDTPLFEDNNEYFKYGFRLYFRYDRFRKEGYLLECSVSDKALIAELCAIDARNEKKLLKKTITPVPAGFERAEWDFTLKVVGDRLGIGLNGVQVAIVDAKRSFPAAGQIGLDKCFYHGELIVREWSITADENVGKSKIAGPLNITLPCVHGMSVPYRYEFSLFKYADGPYELDIKLSGGIKDRPDRGKCGAQWCHEINMLKSPYVRIDSSKGEVANLILYNGLMVLLDREEKRVWMLDRYAKIEWPLTRKICLDDLPDLDAITFAAGYEYFENEPQCILAGGPFEVLTDSRGKLLYSGQALRMGCVALAVKSSDTKLVCSRLPANIPDREKALVHARKNHYFYEKEKIIFNIRINYHSAFYYPKEFALSVKVQSVYGDILGNKIRLTAQGGTDAQSELLKDRLGVVCLRYTAKICGNLAAGVYHLAVKLQLGNKPIYDEKTIFEVMSRQPDAVPPPVASGLPILFSIPNEIKYLETDAFDPRTETAGAMHYFSMCSFYPEYARQKRIWELIKFYQRKWFLTITRRTPSRDLSIAQNKDLIAQCNFLQIGIINNRGRYDLWKANTYTNEVLDILIDFFEHNPEQLKRLEVVSLKLLAETRNNKCCLAENALEELVANCWKEWLAYFSCKLAGILDAQHASLKAINGKIGRSSGGPYSVYGAHNKSAYFMNYFGHNRRGGTAKYIDGFWQYEDYCHSCGYSITRAVFGLMTLKLCYPSWKIFPEIYATRCLDGCSDGAVSQAHPPFGFYNLPSALVRLPAYEYAFAASWFADKKFRFWTDYGFHLRALENKCIKEFVGAWGNVVKHKPVRPVKTTCFLMDWDLIEKHPDYYEKNCNVHTSWKDVNNTAEQALAYTYASARNAGLPAGFVTSLEGLKNLKPDMTDLLVLPPLNENMPKGHIETIRNLHRQGVNLLGFENIAGLEDLFGVKPLAQNIRIRKIGVKSGDIAGIGALEDEFAEHELCRAGYANAGATVILAGAETPDGALDVPVLLVNKTRWGHTAFFNIPPTVVKRDSFIERVGYGQECLSVIINRASDYVIRKLSKPMVSSQDAKVIAFHDEHGDLVVVVEEESLAVYSDAIKYPRPFLLNLDIPGINRDAIRSEYEYSVAHERQNHIVLRLSLGKFESAIFVISGINNR